MVDNILYDETCEKTVLGTILSEREAIYQVRDILTPDSFYSMYNRNIYNAILAITSRGDRADIVSIIPELQKHVKGVNVANIAELGDYHSFDLNQYAYRLAELQKWRAIHNLGLRLQTCGQSDDLLEVISDANDSLNSIHGESINHIKAIGEYLPELHNLINDNLNGKEPEFIHTGFTAVDQRCLLQPNSLMIIGGESSSGKTSFANAIVLNAAKTDARIAYYSMEMCGKQINMRFASMLSGIPCGRLYNSKLAPEEINKFDAAIGTLSNLKIFFDDRSTSSIDTIISSIRSMKIKNNINMAVIDYIQILSVNTKSNNVEFQLAEIGRRLKNLCKEISISILLLSQLSRNADNPEPTLTRLRGSGQILECCDIAALIYRPSYYEKVYGKPFHYSGEYKDVETKTTAEINFAKCRNSDVFSFICGFDPQTTRFYDLHDTPKLPFKEIQDDDPF
jgi:replicative DNA helicase